MKPGWQREKGKQFERKVARIFRARWPDAVVRRASQAERAHNPDIFTEVGPLVLRRLWCELQDSATPNPSAKIKQARRDIAADPRRYSPGENRIAVAITHKRGAASAIATINIGDLMDVLNRSGSDAEAGDVSMPLETFLAAVDRGVRRQRESEAT